MKIILFYVLFLFCLKSGQSQIDSLYTKNYINNFSFINSNSKCLVDLHKYDYFFFGETHKTRGLGENYLKLFKILNNDINTIFIEYPCSYYNFINDYFYKQIIDTLSYSFNRFANDFQLAILSRGLYINNSNKLLINRKKIIPIDLDELTSIEPNDILQYYNTKDISEELLNDLELLKKRNTTKKRKQKEKQYQDFFQVFKNHKTIHIQNIGILNYNKINMFLSGLSISLKSKKDVSWFKSQERENFMFENIVNEIKQNDSIKFISYNGHFHIPLNIPEEWVGVKNWESLAYKIKVAYPQKKVCSIYLMNRTNDKLSDQYFSTEKKLIIDNTRADETYLIRLDGEGTPFKELSQKFQYIVVW